MKLTIDRWLDAGRGLLLGLCLVGTMPIAAGQGISTTTVQGTVYQANGQAGAGTLSLSWPAFTTAGGQAVAAGEMTLTIPPDGFVSVNLAPNQGATPAGLYYTAIYQLSGGTTSTEYWVVPAAAQASLGQVRAQLMPAAQAVQTVSKAYVDQTISELTESLLTASGGTLSGPLYLNGDPAQALQAADKHYVDASFSEAMPLSGGAATGPLTAMQLGAAYQVDQFPGADFGAKLQGCLSALSAAYGGTCDARNFTGTLGMGSSLTIATGNATVELPCATIATANQMVVTAGTRNVTVHGCALRGASTASGSQGGTVLLYSGSKAAIQVGDPTYAADTMGFHMDNVVVNTTAATSATAQGLVAYRTQEIDLAGLYLLGNSNQTGMTLDGTGNYTGGSFAGNQFSGFQTAVNAIGHQVANAATTDWMNASTFVRLHIDCPTSGGSPMAGTTGINLQQGDGNTFTGGDVEGCNTAMHLGANAQNNTIVGLRNENSNNQVVADAGSAYNNWVTGGTMFTGQLTDNGTRNSFLDTFHRSFNGLNGDWYGSQKDATVTNHYRIGTGTGNERGLLNRYQTDYGYRWTTGLSDATAGEQFYQVLDELNNVYRLSIGQYNNGQSSTNDQTVVNAAGTGAVVLNGSNNAGTGGVVIGSGGASETTVATINNQGNAQFNGTLQVGGATTLAATPTVKNQADAEIDATLWAGLTASQKESFSYKDWNGNSQWYMEKDASNNWELNSATGGLDSFKAYQSTNSGDTYINASNATGVVRVNYETGSGTGFNVYGGGSGALYASFTGANAIKFPGLAAGSGHNCLQVDNSGYLTNTGSACGNGSVNASSTVYGSSPLTSLQTNLSAASAALPVDSTGVSHGTITLDPTLGVYQISTSIKLPCGVHFDGQWAHINVAAGVNNPFVIACAGEDPSTLVDHLVIEYNGALANGYVPNTSTAFFIGGDPAGAISASTAAGDEVHLQDLVVTGFNAVVKGGNNFFVDDFENIWAFHNYNVVQDTVCGSMSGEDMHVKGGQWWGQYSNAMVLNCGSEWTLDGARLDYSNEGALSGLQAEAEITGTNVNVSINNAHLEHVSGPYVYTNTASSSSNAGRVTITNSTFFEAGYAQTRAISACSVSSGVATLTVAANYFDRAQLVAISGFTGGCSALNGQTLTILANCSNCTQIQAYTTIGNIAQTSDTGTAATVSEVGVVSLNSPNAVGDYASISSSQLSGNNPFSSWVSTSGAPNSVVTLAGNSAQMSVTPPATTPMTVQTGNAGLVAQFGTSSTSSTNKQYMAVSNDAWFGFGGGAGNAILQSPSGHGVQVTSGNGTFGSGMSALFDQSGNFCVGNGGYTDNCSRNNTFSVASNGATNIQGGLILGGQNTPFMVQSNATTSQGIPGKIYCPNLAAGQLCSTYMGVDGTTPDDGLELDYYFAGVGNVGNYWQQRLASGTVALKGDSYGNVTMPVSVTTPTITDTGVPGALVVGTNSSGQLQAATMVGMSGGAPVKATNTYGCLDGRDHLPCEVAKVAPTTYTGTTPQTAILLSAPAAVGYYRMCSFLSNTTAATAGTSIYVSAVYTSYGAAHTSTFASLTTPATANSVANGCVSFTGDASANVSMQLSFNAVTGTPTTQYWLTLERMQ